MLFVVLVFYSYQSFSQIQEFNDLFALPQSFDIADLIEQTQESLLIPEVHVSSVKRDSVSDIKKIALDNSACGNSAPSNRSKLKSRSGYYQGVILSFARSVCRPNDDIKQSMLKGSINREKDVLYYFKNSGNVKTYADLSLPDEKHLKSIYAILLPHGLMESGGDFREGVDISNASSFKSNTAEAGLFQTSYNVRGFMSPAAVRGVEKLEDQYKLAGPNSCMLDVFSEGLPAKQSHGVVGSGAGAAFQKQLRSCPALAVEHAAITIRHNMRHYGPLIRQSSRPLNGCYAVLDKVYDYVSKNKNDVCPDVSIKPEAAVKRPIAKN